MTGIFSRTEMLLGAEAMEKLAASRVAVFGVGGVGGHAMEALVRSGVGAIDLIDHDTVDETNLNRQIIATIETIGRLKVEVAAERIATINPECRVTIHDMFYLPGGEDSPAASGDEASPAASGDEASPAASGGIDFSDYDYVIDAIDTVAGKLGLIEAAKAAGTPIICSMGAGNKLDASAFKVADIYDTTICPLAKVIRRECRKRGIGSLKVVYSEEEPRRPYAVTADRKSRESEAADTVHLDTEGSSAEGLNTEGLHTEGSSAEGSSTKGPHTEESNRETPTLRKVPPGSVAFAPAVAGLIMAGEVVRDLCGR